STTSTTSTTLASGSGGLGGSTTTSTTSTTSTTLLSGSGDLTGSTTTIPTGGRGQAPPTGGQPQVSAGQSQLIAGQAVSDQGSRALSDRVPQVASGQAAQADTPAIPAGAATDLGFFKPGSWLGSSAPWILMILGGVLLMGTGAFGLLSRRISSATR
ncbi:MAG TPA: hypothetical protein VFJ79_08375, partial [Acidimicrobiales bacterium]|nr:hypothetical protein [Acidimicrobiales bacterium]